MPIMDHVFHGRAPSVPQVRAVLHEAEKKGADFITMSYGEQSSDFQQVGGHWHHQGNGLLRAAYKVADEEDAKRFASPGRFGR